MSGGGGIQVAVPLKPQSYSVGVGAKQVQIPAPPAFRRFSHTPESIPPSQVACQLAHPQLVQ